ncbi:MAG: OB-fold domain-containing protein [Rhizobiaceae bacterium]
MDASSETGYRKPLPEMEPEEKPFWESLRQHRMKIQHCEDCGKWCFLPRTMCPHCLSTKLEWKPVSGRGRIFATTTQHHPPSPAFAQDVPYNISLVELDEGVRMITNVIGCPVESIKIGMAVNVVYDDVTEDVTLAKFRPAGV